MRKVTVVWVVACSLLIVASKVLSIALLNFPRLLGIFLRLSHEEEMDPNPRQPDTWPVVKLREGSLCKISKFLQESVEKAVFQIPRCQIT